MKLNTTIFSTLAIVLAAAVFTSCEKEKNAPNNPDSENDSKTDVEYWLTTKDQASLFQKIDHPLLFKEAATDLPVIEVDTTQRFQIH